MVPPQGSGSDGGGGDSSLVLPIEHPGTDAGLLERVVIVLVLIRSRPKLPSLAGWLTVALMELDF